MSGSSRSNNFALDPMIHCLASLKLHRSIWFHQPLDDRVKSDLFPFVTADLVLDLFPRVIDRTCITMQGISI